MANIRRDIFEAKQEAPVRAGWLLRQIQNLYQIEKRLREQRAGPRLRNAVRAAQAAPVMRRIQKALLLFKAGGRHLPRSGFGQALHYALGQWSAMEPYPLDGRILIDYNPTENAICLSRPRSLALRAASGWLSPPLPGPLAARPPSAKRTGCSSATPEPGDTAATLYTIIESARRLGIDPEAYLTDLLTRLPSLKRSELVKQTPAAWAKARPRRAA